MKSVAILELGLMDQMVPLVGGYLEAYANRDPWLRQSYRIEKLWESARVDQELLLKRLVDCDADIYALSCYVWNTGLIKALLPQLRALKPEAQYILGGPQVMDQAPRILLPETANVTICNGEGETTFADYLRELTESKPDLHKVGGLSFIADGTVVTTDKRQRLTSIDDIPSPFLTGLFRGQYRMSILETNRGCPFHCSFCYWGAATNDRVYSFDRDRVRDEIAWIAKQGIPFMFLADANWGMRTLDVEQTRHIAECRKQYLCPQTVFYSAAKNSPDRVCEIVEILDSAGILAAQPISLQTQDDHTLQVISRENIKKDAYARVQKRLAERHISSFTEVIWPLPGETLTTYTTGVASVCRAAGHTNTIISYPHLLLVNTPMHRQREALGLVTKGIGDGRCESELIISTATASYDDYLDGLRFYFATLLAYNSRGLRNLMAYLDAGNRASYERVLSEFGEYCRANVDRSPLFRYIEDESIAGLEAARYNNFGAVMHYALWQHRSDFQDLLCDFVASRSYCADREARLVFELDRVLLPFIYSTPTRQKSNRPFDLLSVTAKPERNISISVPEDLRALAATILAPYGGINQSTARSYSIDHVRHQFPHWPAKGMQQNADYCYAMLLRIERITPVCYESDSPAAALGARTEESALGRML
jgi:hypothetical protein